MSKTCIAYKWGGSNPSKTATSGMWCNWLTSLTVSQGKRFESDMFGKLILMLMEINEMTIEQARELAELLYPFEIMGEFEMEYQPYIEEWYRDARELIRIKFESYTFGDKVEPIRIHIEVDLNCWVYYLRLDEKLNYDILHSLPTRNQYKVQEKFREWGFIPKEPRTY